MSAKIIACALLIFGEVITIYAEIAGARAMSKIQTVMSLEVITMALILMFGSLLLFSGYCLGVVAFKGIWTVTVLSVTTILIIEPLLSYYLFREVPSIGASIGLVCGGIGMTVALLF